MIPPMFQMEMKYGHTFIHSTAGMQQDALNHTHAQLGWIEELLELGHLDGAQ